MIKNEEIVSFLAVWGALVSTTLAVFTILKFSKEHRISVLLLAKVSMPFEMINIEISNRNRRPITVKEIEIGVGTHKNNIKNLTILTDLNVKLNDSELYSEVIGKEEIINKIKELKYRQREFDRLWIRVILSNKKNIIEPVFIDSRIIPNKYYKKAEQFIATDLFLGFDQKDSNTYFIDVRK
ncbi:hypothetical protein [Aquimarina sp. LLG6339-5]|uniref:hypothetical protein n=1 Tax=Aquimarina sp. LLG6339-5 TaxID=3160830 RepID=UPI003866E6CB